MDALQHVRRILRGHWKFNDDDLSDFLRTLATRTIRKGERLFVRGEMPVAGFVMQGCLRVFFTEEDGAERILYFAPEGWCVTAMAAVSYAPSVQIGIEALEHTNVMVATTPSVHTESDRIWRALAEPALLALQTRLIGGLRKSAAARYLEFRQLYPGLDLRIPQYHVAAYLGVSPEFFSKLRKRLLRDDYLATPQLLVS